MCVSATAENIIRSFHDMKVLVIGDVMIDSYLIGKVERISPEAPVPVVNLIKRENRLGGAANVALNLKALGAIPYLCAVTGNDSGRNALLELLLENDLPAGGITECTDRRTTLKYRVIGNRTQLIRVDEESDHEVTGAEFEKLKAYISERIDQGVDVVIFQDYDKGLITPELIDFTTRLTIAKGIPVTVDPKRRNFNAYRNVSLFKPNLKELREGIQRDIDPADPEFGNILSQFMDRQNILGMMITLSERGIYMANIKDGIFSGRIYPVKIRSVADVSGAGDTVISVASLCLANGINPDDTAAISNIAGSLVCEEAGVVPLNPEKFRARLISDL